MQPDGFIGKQIDDFTIEERIGVGGMATVYRAYQPSVNRSVALKIIRLDSNAGETPEFARRFEQEAKVIAALEHLHILPIYDYGIVNNELAYFAMRLLKGGSLSGLLADGALDLDRACDIFTQVARGLGYAHQNGVVHRDFKPSNILMDEAGNAYLTDFGLAKMMQESEHLTKTGTIVGTPVYMSPEQLRGDDIDPRSDIYSMGVILYHMLVGRPPFDSSESNMISVIYQHLEKQPIPPCEINPAIPPEVEAVIMKALHKQPAERYQTAEAMAHAFNNALGRRISTGSYPVPRPSQIRQTGSTVSLRRQTNQSYVMVGVAGVLMIVVLLGALVLASQPGGLFNAATETPTVTPSPTPPPVAVVEEGTTGTTEEVIPNDAEIEAARTRLGENGMIGYVTCNLSSEYHATQAREMGDLAARYGLAYRIYDSDNDRYAQLTQIERARADGIKGLILCPLDTELLSTTLTSVQEAGIPLVLVQSDMPNYGGVLMGGDDYLLGFEAGRAAGEMIRDEWGGNARVIILDFPTMPVIVTRANGMEDGVKELAPDVIIVGRYIGGTRDNGYNSVQDLLEDGVEFDVILSINDVGSYGAIDALAEADMDPLSVIVSSVDAEALAQQYIAESYYMRASVAVSRRLSSDTNINAMVRLLAGATLPELILVPPGQVITRETLEENR